MLFVGSNRRNMLGWMTVTLRTYCRRASIVGCCEIGILHDVAEMSKLSQIVAVKHHVCQVVETAANLPSVCNDSTYGKNIAKSITNILLMVDEAQSKYDSPVSRNTTAARYTS